MSQDYVAKLIRRAVDANTSIEGTGGNAPNYTRALSKYFSNPKYVDIGSCNIFPHLTVLFSCLSSTAPFLVLPLRDLLTTNSQLYFFTKLRFLILNIQFLSYQRI
jgi:hypothetical protein